MGFYALNQAISVGQPLLQPNVSGISEGPLSHEGTTKWEIIIKKRQAFAIGDLCTCVCGEVANPLLGGSGHCYAWQI